jgi:hypothetical protein
VDKTAEAVCSLNTASTAELLGGEVGDGHLEVNPAVRARAVIVLHELTKDAVQVALVPDQ